MFYREIQRPVVLFAVVFAILCAGIASRRLLAKEQNPANRTNDPLPAASPTPRQREELPQDSDEVVKVETNLTNIFFTAADPIADSSVTSSPKTFAFLKMESHRTSLLFSRTSTCRYRSRY